MLLRIPPCPRRLRGSFKAPSRLSTSFQYFSMSNDAHTSSPVPRQPDQNELQQLTEYLQSLGGDDETNTDWATSAYVAVYDNYITDGPGYCGKIMSVIWTGSPSFFDVFTWENGEL